MRNGIARGGDMAGKRNWLMGCGIGCLTILIVIAVGGALLYRTGRQFVAHLDEVGESQGELTRLYGELRDYEPPADGRFAPGRIETFLRVQEDIAEVGAELSAHGKNLRDLEEGGGGGPRKLIVAVKSLVGLGKSVAGYLEQRNEALLGEGMGLGEYSYIYLIAYHAWMGHELRPVFSVHDQEDMGPRIARLQGYFETWLRAQRAAAAAAGEDPQWLQTLDDDIRALGMAELRVPWCDGLPARTSASLEPYYERLEASYRPLGPLLCIGAETAGDGFDFQVQ